MNFECRKWFGSTLHRSLVAERMTTLRLIPFSSSGLVVQSQPEICVDFNFSWVGHPKRETHQRWGASLVLGNNCYIVLHYIVVFKDAVIEILALFDSLATITPVFLPEPWGCHGWSVDLGWKGWHSVVRRCRAVDKVDKLASKLEMALIGATVMGWVSWRSVVRETPLCGFIYWYHDGTLDGGVAMEVPRKGFRVSMGTCFSSKDDATVRVYWCGTVEMSQNKTALHCLAEYNMNQAAASSAHRSACVLRPRGSIHSTECLCCIAFNKVTTLVGSADAAAWIVAIVAMVLIKMQLLHLFCF